MSDRDIQITLNARVSLPPVSQKRPFLKQSWHLPLQGTTPLVRPIRVR